MYIQSYTCTDTGFTDFHADGMLKVHLVVYLVSFHLFLFLQQYHYHCRSVYIYKSQCSMSNHSNVLHMHVDNHLNICILLEVHSPT